MKEIFDRLTSDSRITVLTGAGMSAESGIPTFRGQGGVWEKYKADELATPQAFKQNPELVWAWYRHRMDLARSVSPHRGHLALAELERFFPRFTLITQNVDNLHYRAGSSRVLELHGNLFRARCTGEDRVFPVPETWQGVPLCPECGANLRPDIVWFGEPLPETVMSQAAQASVQADYFLVVGTSALVYPAAGLPLLAKQNRAQVIEVNTEKTPLSEFTIYLPGKASEILPRLVEAAKARLA